MEILVKDNVRYVRHQFDSESQFELVVLSQFKFIFGENAILFNKQKIRTETGIGTIPDAFVIAPDKGKWYIIEIELSIHDVYQHIIPQMIKFKNAIDNHKSRKELAKAFDRAIDSDLTKLASWVLCTGSKEVYRHLSEIVEDEPELLIIIDNPKKELENSINHLPFITSINVFKTFCREGFGLGDDIYHFDTFNTSKKVQKENASNFTNKPFLKEVKNNKLNNGKRNKAKSPSAYEWVSQIKDLSNVSGLGNWAAICKHINIHVGGNSARRALSDWVKINKASWVPVPDA